MSGLYLKKIIRENSTLKGQCNKNFYIFLSMNPPGPMINRLLCFGSKIHFREDIQILKVRKIWLCAVLACTESTFFDKLAH